MTNNDNNLNTSDLDPVLDAPPWFDLSRYSPSFNRGKPQWYIFLWWLVEGVIFPLTPHPLNRVRTSLLRLFGAKIGKSVVIRSSVRVLFPWKVEVGDYSWLGDNVYLYSLDNIKIGSHSIISQNCYLCAGSHNMDDIAFDLKIAPILIGNGVWVASDCFVAPGVKIGANSVIGARSSVFKNIPAEYIAWGSPCKAHQKRSPLSGNQAINE